LRAVGCLGKQVSLACLFAGRGRLPSPRVARGWDRLSAAFRYYATIRLLSSRRHLVVGSSMTTALHAEAERSPRVSTQNFVPTPSPIRPPVRRIWASLPLASSPQVRTPLTALRFRSVRYCIVRLLPDAPSRVVRCCERPCLVDDGFPPSGPQEDLTLHVSPRCSVCMPSTPRLRSLRSPLRGLDTPSALPRAALIGAAPDMAIPRDVTEAGQAGDRVTVRVATLSVAPTTQGPQGGVIGAGRRTPMRQRPPSR
jgi:hypothetical protein